MNVRGVFWGCIAIVVVGLSYVIAIGAMHR